MKLCVFVQRRGWARKTKCYAMIKSGLVSNRGGATGSKGHQLILSAWHVSAQAMIFSGARCDFCD